MRDAAFACIRRVGVETGGSNVQFAIDPADGRMVIIEMNPRVSRSSALASKATGFPIAKIAARLAVGLHPRRDPQRHHQGHAGQLRTGHRLCGHQGSPLGVREVPRHRRRSRHPDAVGGRGDGHRAHVPGVAPEGVCVRWSTADSGLNCRSRERRRSTSWDDEELLRRADNRYPPTDRSSWRRRCGGASRSTSVAERTKVRSRGSSTRSPMITEEREPTWRTLGLPGSVGRRRLAPGQAARLRRRSNWPTSGEWTEPDGPGWASVRLGVRATFKTVDTCAAEFAADTPYHYSTYEDTDEVVPERATQGRDPRLGAQPHRPGHRVRLLLRPCQLRPTRRRLTRRS